MLWRSVPGRGLELAVWRQPKALRSTVPWVEEWCATWGVEYLSRKTWEKVWACRRSKAPLLGRVRRTGVDRHRNLPTHVCMDSQRAGRLWNRLWMARSHLVVLQETGHFLYRLWVARHLLCGLEAAWG